MPVVASNKFDTLVLKNTEGSVRKDAVINGAFEPVVIMGSIA